MKVETVHILAELLAGLSVPGSNGLLGEADEPWRKLRKYYSLKGWESANEIHAKIIACENGDTTF